MSRLAVAAICGAFLISPLPVLAAPASAGAAECTWQRHSKRVVKRVRRHGKVRRVTRVKRWWTCRAVAAPPPAPAAPPAAAIPPPAPPAAAPQPAPPAPEEPGPPNRLGVRAFEFDYVLSRPSVAAGAVTVELNNLGEDAHDLNLRREGGAEPTLALPETGPGARAVASFELQAGSYRLWCSVPLHDEWGMNATLLVE